jgi:hypothetical protein
MPYVRDAASIYGPEAAIVDGDLTVDDCRAINDAGIEHIVIKSAKDISNLQKIDKLSRLDILAVTAVDISSVSELVGLRRLCVGGNWFGRLSLRLLKNLEVFGGSIRHSHGSLQDIALATRLRYARGNFSEAQLRELTQCKRLKTLDISLTRFTTLDWLKDAAGLNALSLTRCSSLACIRGIEHTPNLQFLKFQECRKLKKLQGIEVLAQLKVLLIDDCGTLDSLAPISKCQSIDVLSFLGDTNIADARVSVLDEIDTLKFVRFIDRKHYDRTSTQFNFDLKYFETVFLKYLSKPA